MKAPLTVVPAKLQCFYKVGLTLATWLVSLQLTEGQGPNPYLNLPAFSTVLILSLFLCPANWHCAGPWSCAP